MHYIMFSRGLKPDQPSSLLEISAIPELKLIHFGDYDRLTQLYVLEGPFRPVVSEFEHIKDREGPSCVYVGEGDVPFDLEDAHTWVWKEFIKQTGMTYIPTVSL
ncbi:MAG: hypothetical protein H6601_08355 [Flavobacteriales bacterium]|nr:hypothetical protein [Flavobacteriales bacterium]